MKLSLTEIRCLLLAQSVEESDPKEAVLPAAERRAASEAAGVPLEDSAGEAEKRRFLVQRAERLVSFLEAREEDVAEAVKHPPFGKFRLVAMAGIVVALIAGFLTNELGPEKKINILAFPLLGILAWNLFVYLREIVGFFRNQSGDLPGQLLDHFLPKKPETDSEGKVEIRQAMSLYRKNWTRALMPVFSARVKALLHLAAAVVAAAAIGGMYVKGLANEYRAIFESTFFTGAESFRPVLEMVLGPASVISQIGIPDLAPLDTEAGANAAPWIHLYAVTMGIFVIVPRLILSLVWRGRSVSRERSIPFREFAPTYFEHLLAVSTGDALAVAVLPYAHDPSAESRKRIQKLAEDVTGGAADLRWLDVVAFGEEEEPISLAESPADLVLLFNFASTPEKETHGMFLNTARQSFGGTRLHVFLDAESFDRKADSFADADERRATRLEAWKLVAGPDFAEELCLVSER